MLNKPLVILFLCLGLLTGSWSETPMVIKLKSGQTVRAKGAHIEGSNLMVEIEVGTIKLHADDVSLESMDAIWKLNNTGPVEYPGEANAEIETSQFKAWSVYQPQGVVVLVNENPDQTVPLPPRDQKELNDWIAFGVGHRFALIYLVLKAPERSPPQQSEDYHAASARALDLLTKGIQKTVPSTVPVYVCGLNGSATPFIQNLADNPPSAIKAWSCGQGASWPNFINPQASAFGLITEPTTDLSAPEAYSFSQLAMEGKKPWTLLSYLPKDAQKTKDLVREYFLALSQAAPGENRSLTTKEVVLPSPETATNMTWLPDNRIGQLWAALHQPREGLPVVIEKTADLSAQNRSNLTFYLRLPPGSKDASDLKGVVAFCTWVKDRRNLFAQLEMTGKDATGITGSLIKFADEHKFAVLNWSTPGDWNPTQSTNDLSDEDQKSIDSEFKIYSEAWEATVESLCQEYKMPRDNFLLYGISRGAQWAHRLVMRKPDRFLAVSIHISSSYDKPSESAKRCLWLVTTGEFEVGYENAISFYSTCQSMGYPIIFKAGVGLAHLGRADMCELTHQFFEYALSVRALRSANAPTTTVKPGGLAASPQIDPLFPESLRSPLFIGDLENQIIYPVDQVAKVLKSFRVALPTKELADAWNAPP